MDYSLPILVIWIGFCILALAVLWLWLKIDEIDTNDNQIRWLTQENTDLKKKMAQVEDLVLKNVGRRR